MTLTTAPVRTVLVCDDRPELREAIGLALSDVPGFRMVGEAIDGVSCLREIRTVRPDVLILDLSMPGGGPQLARAAKDINPAIHIMVFSGRRDARLQNRC